MTLSQVVCQECGNLVATDECVKVTSEGWVCASCCEEWRQGNDVY